MDDTVPPPDDDPVPPDDQTSEETQAPTHRKEPPLSPRARRWLIIGATSVVLLVVGVWLWANFWYTPPVTSTQRNPAVPITLQATPLNNLQEVRGWFGPWDTAVGDTGDSTTLVMLRSNGAVELSSYRIGTKTWPTATLDELTIEANATQVRLRTVSGMIYTLKPGQPFILDTRPNQVYAVQAAPDQQFVVRNQPAEWAHAHAGKAGSK